MTPALHDAVSGLLTVFTLIGWLAGKRPDNDDPDTVEAHLFVLDALSDADAIRTLDCVNDGDLRSQLTVEQAMELAQEAELRGYSRRN